MIRWPNRALLGSHRGIRGAQGDRFDRRTVGEGLIVEWRQIVYSVAAFADEMSEFLVTKKPTESGASVHSFVKELQVKHGRSGTASTIPVGAAEDNPIKGAGAAEIDLYG